MPKVLYADKREASNISKNEKKRRVKRNEADD
jgi:hypothetical protein